MRCVKCGTYIYEDENCCPNCKTPITESINYENRMEEHENKN